LQDLRVSGDYEECHLRGYKVMYCSSLVVGRLFGETSRPSCGFLPWRTFRPSRWTQYIPRRLTFAGLYGFIYQNTELSKDPFIPILVSITAVDNCLWGYLCSRPYIGLLKTHYIVTCMRLAWRIIMGSGFDGWIYWTLIPLHSSGLQAIIVLSVFYTLSSSPFHTH
jgi:hypothetical protein